MTNRYHDDGFAAAWSDPLSRRALLRAASAGIGALAFGGVAACTSDTPGSTQQNTATDAGADPGGDISTTLANTFGDFDPTTAPWVGTIAINNFLYESLYRLDPFPPRADLTPELATELPREVDPVTYRISLRDDVVFHDGSPLTGDDVVFTIERIKDPDVQSLFAPFFDIIESVEAVGEHEVELRLTDPTTLLAQRLVLVKGMSRAAVDASPKTLALEPVGTGPYRVASAVSGQEVTLERFDDYTGPREVTYDEVHIGVTADGNARVSGLRSGQTQVIENVPASSFEGLDEDADINVEGARGSRLTGLVFHSGKPPFDDVRVRQAVMFAIDRDAITESVFFGHAEPTWAGEISPDDPDYAEPDLVYRYDPEHAQQLLAEAGYGDGEIEVDFLVGSNIDYLDAQAPLVEENLRAVGFVPNLIPGELESLYSRVSDGTFNLFLMFGDTGALGATDAEFFLRWTYYGVKSKQLWYWDGEPLVQLEEQLDRALTASDDATRADAMARAQNIIQSEVPIGRLHRADYLTGWSSSLQGFRPIPTSGFLLDGVTG